MKILVAPCLVMMTTPAFAGVIKPLPEYTGMVYAQTVYTEDAFTFPVGRAKCKITEDKLSGKIEYDLVNGRTVQAWGAYTVGAYTLTAGTLFVPSGNDFPAPNAGLFCWSHLYALQPGLFDRGVTAAYAGAVKATVGLINGSGLAPKSNHHPVLDGNVNATRGPLYGSCNVRWSADLRYAWAIAQVTQGPVTVRGHAMSSENMRTYAERHRVEVDAEFTAKHWRVGISLGDGGYLEGDLEYTIQGASRIVLTGLRNAWGSQPEVKVMAQRAFSFHS